MVRAMRTAETKVKILATLAIWKRTLLVHGAQCPIDESSMILW